MRKLVVYRCANAQISCVITSEFVFISRTVQLHVFFNPKCLTVNVVVEAGLCRTVRKPQKIFS